MIEVKIFLKQVWMKRILLSLRTLHVKSVLNWLVNKRGVKDGKILDADPTNVDNYFEPVYCYKCAEMVAEPMNTRSD
ncbi:hypothetical protein [Bacillus sp. MZGC1]|uniref:hypothetical protein n=1 Tax=Bacillus sp. MZGC1 TaxID=2108543 RepID=UPI000D0294AE|nr:hypothetical protein [Bacillus sp. MZGC1]PRS47511.1 hypothetical protein C6Y06_18340 [Bacillus sp. MZGC1]